MVAEINRGSKIYLHAPLAQTPINFGNKGCTKPKLCIKFEVTSFNGWKNKSGFKTKL